MDGASDLATTMVSDSKMKRNIIGQ